MMSGGRTRPGVLVVVGLAVLVAATVLAPSALAAGDGGGAGAGGNSSATNATEAETETGPYSYEDLSRGGAQVSEWTTSRRPLGQYGSVTLLHYAAKPWVEFGSRAFLYVRGGTTVERNRVLLLTNRFPRDGRERTYTIKIVYWQKDTRQVTKGNETTVEPYAKNQTVATVKRDIDGGESTVEVPLQPHWNQKYEVTMWLVGPDGQEVQGARWRYQHHSDETMQPVSVDNVADLLWWGLVNIVVPFLGGSLGFGFLGGLARKRAVVGPRKSKRFWFFLSVMGAMLTLTVFWDGLASLLVNAKFVMGVLPSGIVFYLVMDQNPGVRKVYVRQPIQTDATSPTGDDARGLLDVYSQVLPVARRPDGRLVVAQKGLRTFLAAIIVGRPVIQTYEDLNVEVQNKATSNIDEEWHIDPHAEELLDYEPVRWILSKPEISRSNLLLGGAAVAVGGTIAQHGLGASPWLGTLALLPVGTLTSVQVARGYCRFTPANVHETSAETTALTLESEYGDAETIDGYRRKYHDELGKNTAERRVSETERNRNVSTTMLETKGVDLDDLDQKEREIMKQARQDEDESGTGNSATQGQTGVPSGD